MNKDYKELISDLTADVEHVNQRIKELDNITDKEDLPEDIEKSMEKEVQDLVQSYNKKIEEMLKVKEQELMTI